MVDIKALSESAKGSAESLKTHRQGILATKSKFNNALSDLLGKMDNMHIKMQAMSKGLTDASSFEAFFKVGQDDPNNVDPQYKLGSLKFTAQDKGGKKLQVAGGAALD